MNSYKLNGQAGHYYRKAICEGLNIPHTEIYKTVMDISRDGIITTKDGRQFKVKLIESNQNKEELTQEELEFIKSELGYRYIFLPEENTRKEVILYNSINRKITKLLNHNKDE